MQRLEAIYDTSQVSATKVYQIKRKLYRYLHQDPYCQSAHPQWIFEPLSGQKSKATIKVNINKIRSGCISEVVGAVASPRLEASDKGMSAKFDKKRSPA